MTCVYHTCYLCIPFISTCYLLLPLVLFIRKKQKSSRPRSLTYVSILKVHSKYNPDIKRFHTHMENNCIPSKQRKDIKVISEINTC